MRDVWIVLWAAVICGLLSGVIWILLPQYDRGPFKWTVAAGAIIGAIVTVVALTLK
jgi:hypothetical protein